MFDALMDAPLASLKPSFVTRRVPLERIVDLDRAATDLRPGDLVVAEILELGQHNRIERPDGRRAHLFPGDRVLLACGARYAPDQFEAEAATAVGPAQMVAAGGIAGLTACAHERMRPATAIQIEGAALDAAGRRLNLVDFALPDRVGAPSLPAVAVAGASMNAGKTWTVGALVRGLRAAGLKVAALKVTGTGAGGDLWRQIDSGAHLAMDFTDVGFATTYRADPTAIEDGVDRLLAAAAAAGAEAAVIEVADGLRQTETARLLASPRFRRRVSGVLFAAGEAMAAEQGVVELRRLGHRVPAVSGLLARSPLAAREAAQSATTPVLSGEALTTPERALDILYGRDLRAEDLGAEDPRAEDPRAKDPRAKNLADAPTPAAA